MLLEGVKQSSLPEMFWESVPSRGPGVAKCPLARGAIKTRNKCINKHAVLFENTLDITSKPVKYKCIMKFVMTPCDYSFMRFDNLSMQLRQAFHSRNLLYNQIELQKIHKTFACTPSDIFSTF
jgi:hypothetical protein